MRAAAIAAARGWRRLALPLRRRCCADNARAIEAVGESDVALRSGAILPAAQVRELDWRISRQVGSIEELWQLIDEDLPNFTEGHAVAAFGRVAGFGIKGCDSTRAPKSLQALLDALEGAAAAGALLPGSVTRVATAMAATSAKPPRLVESLAQDVQRRPSAFDAVEVAALSRAFVHFKREAPVQALVEAAAPRAGAFGSQLLVTVCWAAASVRLKQSDAVLDLLDEATRRGDRLRPAVLSQLTWAVSTLRMRQPYLMEALLPHLAHTAQMQDPQGLSSTLGALAALRPKPTAPVGWLENDAARRLFLQSLRRIEDFRGPELTGLARAVVQYGGGMKGAWLGNGDALVMEAITQEAMRKVCTLEPRHFSGLVWAMAKCRHNDQDALRSLAEGAVRHAPDCRAEEVGALVWGLATLQLRHVPLLAALGQRLQRLELEGRTPFRVISSLIWSHAVLRVGGEVPFDEGLLQAAAQRAHESTAQELANLAWANVFLGRPRQDLLAALAIEVQARMGKDFSTQELANASWAFCMARVGDDRLFNTLSARFVRVAASPLHGDAECGRDWASMVDALLVRGGGLAPVGTPQAELVAVFEDAICEPVFQRLRRLAEAQRGAPQGSRDNDRALRALENFAEPLSLGHLGVQSTEGLLRRCGFATELSHGVTEAAWIPRARAEVLARQPHSQATGRRSRPREVVVWLSFEATVCVLGEEGSVWEPGRVARYNQAAKPTGPLLPLSGSGRECHAERTAMCEVHGSIEAAESRLRRRALLSQQPQVPGAGDLFRPRNSVVPSDVRGSVRLFVSQTPCLSCLAILAQFAQIYPGVSLSVAFMDARGVVAASEPPESAGPRALLPQGE